MLRLLLQSSENYIILVVDTIGTGGQGDKFQKVTAAIIHPPFPFISLILPLAGVQAYTYMNLGVNEAKDVVNAVKWVRDNNCFVDGDRIALWGW